MRLISQIDRERISGQMSRMSKLIEHGSYGDMTHEEAYDAVYRTTMHPDHKRDRLKNIGRITGNG